MLAINMADVVNVLNTCKPYLIGFAVVLVLSLIHILEGIGVIGNSKLIIDDTPGISITELRSKCRKMKLEYGLSMVIIDYLQLM